MRIGIDARFYGTLGKGLGRYTQKLIENLEKIDNSNRYFVFLRKENFEDYQPKNKNFTKVLADFEWYTFSEQFGMPRLLSKYNLDLVHFPHFNVPLFYRKKFIVTIHDLILLHFPTLRGTTLNSFFYFIKYLAYKIVIKSAIRRAEKVIAVSNFTKKDILENYRIDSEKVTVTHEACDKTVLREKNEDDEEILKKYGIIKPYILYVGNAYPHKNLERLVLVFKDVILKKNNLSLVLVGKMDYFYKRLKSLAEENKVSSIIFAGNVSDSDLEIVYKSSLAYIFPSLYEGFGIPPLEAMSYGIPVASSNHPCMKEVLGESAYYFDGKKETEIKEAVIKTTEDEELRRDLIKRGLERVKKYNWKKMAEQTLAIYESATNAEK